jgi:hypothetical protein
MRYIAHLTLRHIFTPLLTLVMMLKNARPSITCQTFRQSTSLFSEKRHVVVVIFFFFTFYFYRPWQWYSTNHARLTDYFNASATQISKWRHWVSCWFCSKYIYIFVYSLKSSIKRKARVQYVDTFITSSSLSSIKSLSWTNV